MVHILIVESSQGYLEFLRDIIKEKVEKEMGCPITVKTTRDFHEAWQELAQPTRWNLLVTDIGLRPRPSQKQGFQLVEEAKRRGIACIVVSGTKNVSKQEAVDSVTKLGALDFIDKGSWDNNRFITGVCDAVGCSKPPEGAQSVRRTSMHLDLADYTEKATAVDIVTGAKGVVIISDEIRGFIAEGLAQAGGSQSKNFMKATGDGAVLLFELPDQAHAFAIAVLRAAKAHNTGREHDHAKRHFRIGAATGDLIVHPLPGGAFDADGVPLIRSQRCEAGANPGEFVIYEPDFFKGLSPEYQAAYGDPEVMTDKKLKKHTVRRLKPLDG